MEILDLLKRRLQKEIILLKQMPFEALFRLLKCSFEISKLSVRPEKGEGSS